MNYKLLETAEYWQFFNDMVAKYPNLGKKQGGSVLALNYQRDWPGTKQITQQELKDIAQRNSRKVEGCFYYMVKPGAMVGDITQINNY
jgi:hypothetical protein